MDVPTDLGSALDRLVDRGVLDRAQAAAVLAEVGAAAPAHRPLLRRLLGEIAGYVGASFVVGATLLFLGEQWDVLGRPGRFAILAGMAVVLAAGGVVVRHRNAADDVRRRLSSTLLTGAAITAGFAAAVLGGSPPPAAASFAGAMTALVVAVAGYRFAPTALGQAGVAGAALTGYATVLQMLDAVGARPIAVGMIGLGALWAVAVWRRLVAERRFAYAISVGLALAGAQTAVIDQNYVGYALTALVAGTAFTAYGKTRDWILLAAGVVGTTLVVPEILFDLTEGALGTSGVLLVAGVTLLAASLAGMRLRPAATPPHPL